MTCPSDIVASSLMGLQRDLVELRQQSGHLAEALGQRRFVPVVVATETLRRVLDNIAATIKSLEPRVMACEGGRIGATVESLGELAVRAQTLLVAAHLRRLCDALQRTGRAASRGLFTGRFRHIGDVAAFVEDRLASVTGTWARYRRGRAPAAELADRGPDQRRIRYRAAVREAQHAVTAISLDPDFAHFLRQGVACVDPPEVHAACVQIALTVQIKLNAEPAPHVFSAAASPSHSYHDADRRKP